MELGTHRFTQDAAFWGLAMCEGRGQAMNYRVSTSQEGWSCTALEPCDKLCAWLCN